MFISGELSRLTPTQRAIVLSKPYWRMRWFASLLNWHGLVLDWMRLSEEHARNSIGVPESRILVHYVTNNREFHIQINELPDGPNLYQATMGPFRYGIGCHLAIGWHRFELFENDAELVAEAQRIKPYLDRQQFRDPVRRAAWKKAHPEFVIRGRKS